MSSRAVGLVVLAAVALALRVGVVLALRTDHARPLDYEHGRIAENLLAGKGFAVEFLGTEGPTSQQAPFYPVLLAAVYGLWGAASPQAVLAVQLLQCAAGTALVLAVAWLGWSLVPRLPAVGWVAAAAAAVFPTHLYAVTHLQVALWAAMGLTLVVAIVLSPRWRGTAGGAVLAGLAAGSLLLIEPILALALPVCAAAFWIGEAKRRRVSAGSETRAERAPSAGSETRAERAPSAGSETRAERAPLLFWPWRTAIMAGVAAAVIAPWTVRNWMVHGEFVFIKDTFGYAFWQGNNPASYGTDKLPKPSAEKIRLLHDGTLSDMDRAMWEARHETVYIDDALLKPGDYRELAGLSEPERGRVLGRRAAAFIRENPQDYARLCLNRLRYFLLFDETNPKAANPVYRAATAVWLVLAGVGLLATLGQWRQFWPTWLIFAAVTLFHALVITSVRFRIPIEPIGLLWASAAVTPVVARMLGWREIRVYRPGQRRVDPFEGAHVLQGPHANPRRQRRAA